MKAKLPYPIALALAETVVIDLAPACDRIGIAGSIRRKKSEIGDIEIVCIPAIETGADLFGQPTTVRSAPDSRLEEIAASRGWRRIKGGDLYRQYDIGPCVLDLFVTTPEKWGVIFTIRTGSADFSRWLVTPRREGGALPGYLKVKDGRLWAGGMPLATPDETDVFTRLELAWIPPEERNRIPARMTVLHAGATGT
jgi:DNA polymerase/3'-5' exonuclease PolX